MYKTFKEHKENIENIATWGKGNDGFKKLGESIGMMLNDWEEERKILIHNLKMAIETVEEMQNFPSVNQMLRMNAVVKKAEQS